MQANWLHDLNIPLTLTALSDAGAFLSHEYQLHLIDLLGKHQWYVDFDEPRFSVTGRHPLNCTAMHLLGSAAEGPRSWLWSWANPSGFAPAASELAARLRDFGSEHGIAEFTTAELPFAKLPGEPERASDASWALVTAAKAVSGIWAAYTGDVGGGTRVALLIDHPDFRLPPPSGPRVMRVIQEGLDGAVRIYDKRLAVQGYAAGRGLRAAWSERSVTLSGPDLEFLIEFDELGRVSSTGFKMQPSKTTGQLS